MGSPVFARTEPVPPAVAVVPDTPPVPPVPPPPPVVGVLPVVLPVLVPRLAITLPALGALPVLVPLLWALPALVFTLPALGALPVLPVVPRNLFHSPISRAGPHATLQRFGVYEALQFALRAMASMWTQSHGWERIAETFLVMGFERLKSPLPD